MPPSSGGSIASESAISIGVCRSPSASAGSPSSPSSYCTCVCTPTSTLEGKARADERRGSRSFPKCEPSTAPLLAQLLTSTSHDTEPRT
eukprot:scaffold100332_cov69-Phaeocystis_antarctica.AAC.3